MNPIYKNKFPHLFHQHEWFTRTLGNLDDDYYNYVVENHLILKQENEQYSKMINLRRVVGDNKKIHLVDSK